MTTMAAQKSAAASEGAAGEAGAWFRRTMGLFPTGVTIITGHDAGERVGFTCQSFVSLSLDPLLVSISIMNTSSSFPRIRASRRFAVNILAAEMHALSSQFARAGSDRWSEVGWRAGEHGLPILEGSIAWVECEIAEEYAAGDHTLVVGRVLGFGSREGESEPLVFHAGRYRTLRQGS